MEEKDNVEEANGQQHGRVLLEESRFNKHKTETETRHALVDGGLKLRVKHRGDRKKEGKQKRRT